MDPVGDLTGLADLWPAPTRDLPAGGSNGVLSCLLGVEDVLLRLAGLEQRPYLISPSNSPTVRRSSQAKSTRATNTPSSSKISCCSSGTGMPSWTIRTRLADSPALSLRISRKSAIHRALRTPGHRYIDLSACCRSSGPRPIRRALSPIGTLSIFGVDLPRSATVRARLVTNIPSMTMTSSSESGVRWIVNVLAALPAGVAVPHDVDGMPESAARSADRGDCSGAMAQHGSWLQLRQRGLDHATVGEVAAGVVFVRIQRTEEIRAPPDRTQCPVRTRARSSPRVSPWVSSAAVGMMASMTRPEHGRATWPTSVWITRTSVDNRGLYLTPRTRVCSNPRGVIAVLTPRSSRR